MFNWDKISKEDRIYIECLNKALDEQEKNAEKFSIEEHVAKGTFNSFAYLAGYLRYNKDTVIKSGGVIRDMAVIDNKNSGILTITYDCGFPEEQLVSWIVERISTLVKNIPYKKEKNDLCSWSVGKYFNKKYKHDNREFTKDSISVEFINFPHEEIMNFAKDLCYAFTCKTVMMKDYDKSVIRFIKFSFMYNITEEMSKKVDEEVKKYLDKENTKDK